MENEVYNEMPNSVKALDKTYQVLKTLKKAKNVCLCTENEKHNFLNYSTIKEIVENVDLEKYYVESKYPLNTFKGYYNAKEEYEETDFEKWCKNGGLLILNLNGIYTFNEIFYLSNYLDKISEKHYVVAYISKKTLETYAESPKNWLSRTTLSKSMRALLDRFVLVSTKE